MQVGWIWVKQGLAKSAPFFVSAISGGDVATARVGRKIKGVAVSAGGEHDRVGRVLVDLTREQIARDDSLGVTIDDDEVEHLGLRKHLHGAGGDLPAKRLITTEQQLLAGLAARVKRPRNLGAAEGTIGEQAAVLAREGHALFDALIDDQIADFGQAINVRFARTKIAAFDRVVKQSVNAVAVVLIILRGVDSALRGDGMGAARRILITKTFHPITELAERGRGRTAGQTRCRRR